MVENTDVQDGPDSGGKPETIARCTACGSTYAAQYEDGELRPIGTDGTCECGNDTFQRVVQS